jgi:hypothetical protein
MRISGGRAYKSGVGVMCIELDSFYNVQRFPESPTADERSATPGAGGTMSQDLYDPKARLNLSVITRRRLFRDLVILSLVVSGAILAVVLTLGYQVTHRISSSLIEAGTQGAQKDIDAYIGSVERSLVIARKWGQSGMLDLGNVSLLNAKFIPILEEMPEIAGVIIARSDGKEYFLRQDKGDWLTRTTLPDQGAGNGLWQRWDGTGKLLDSWSESSGYDPRKRPWFQGAVASEAADKVFWTRPYLFFSLEVPGVTVSSSWRQADRPDMDYVVGFDVLLDDIFELVSGLHLSTHGSAFLFSKNGSVLMPRSDYTEGDRQAPGRLSYLTPAEGTGLPGVAGAVEKWKQDGGTLDRPVEYQVQGKTWWAGFSPLTLQGEGLWLGIAVPEEDLLGQKRKSRITAALLLVLILSAGILATALLVRRYGRLLRNLPIPPADRSDMENRLRALIERGEGPTVEFKSTMRVNLKNGKPEKGIEMAWLKTVAAFLNTEGGTLFIGVDDRGSVQGIDPDGLENDDKCRLHFKNLMAEHIGVEHTGSVRMELHSVEGRKIALVECERSAKPVFLTQGKEEGFYIRSGPSSLKLPLSKALQYLEGRK